MVLGPRYETWGASAPDPTSPSLIRPVAARLRRWPCQDPWPCKHNPSRSCAARRATRTSQTSCDRLRSSASLKWANASLNGIANRLRPLAGENHLDLVRLSPNLPWAQQRLSLQGWILALRVVSYIGTKTTGARSPPRAVRLPTHGSALILGASCVDRGLSSKVNVPTRQPVPAINRFVLIGSVSW
jgi:hypothetical protein